jgi:ribosomal protein S12 methylthiotransferase
LAEAESLARQGVRELILIAQDTTRYGVELGLRDGLAGLLRDLARIDGVEWVRFLYAYPTTISDQVLEAMSDDPKLCLYLDIPLQHASDRILKAMKRPGTKASNLQLIERIRQAVPGVALRSSFIVGFPGETPEEFEELMEFCREVEFDHLGVFTYSNEEDTAAFVPQEAMAAREKKRRRHSLMKQQTAISVRINRERVGSYQKVLIEGPSPESELLLRGRTECQAPGIDGGVLINEIADGSGQPPSPGTFVTVEVTEAHPYDLVGRIVVSRGREGSRELRSSERTA